jgi:hypothetical protein
MPKRPFPVKFHFLLTMPYDPGSFECDVSAYSREKAVLLAGQAAAREDVYLNEESWITVEQVDP